MFPQTSTRLGLSLTRNKLNVWEMGVWLFAGACLAFSVAYQTRLRNWTFKQSGSDVALRCTLL